MECRHGHRWFAACKRRPGAVAVAARREQTWSACVVHQRTAHFNYCFPGSSGGVFTCGHLISIWDSSCLFFRWLVALAGCSGEWSPHEAALVIRIDLICLREYPGRLGLCPSRCPRSGATCRAVCGSDITAQFTVLIHIHDVEYIRCTSQRAILEIRHTWHSQHVTK